MRRGMLIGLGVVVAGVSASALGQGASRREPPEAPTRIEFGGGTVGQYIALVQREFRGVGNVVVEPDAKIVAIGPVELTLFDAHAAASAVQFLEVDPEKDRLRVKEGPEYVVIGVERPGPTEADTYRETRVWTLAAILERGFEDADVLSAVRNALELAGSGAEVRFHEDTQLLMVRGTGGELEAVDQVVSNLNMIANWRENQLRDQKETAEQAELQQRIEELKEERDDLRQRLREMELFVQRLQMEIEQK